MKSIAPHRIIWAFGFGYFCFYAPYSAMVKLLTTSGATGAEILPLVLAGTILSMPLAITALGWWKYLGRMSLSAPVIASGVGTAAIIAMTTLVYTFNGVSIVFALLLMRGGVLIISPFVDLYCSRRVRWFSWTALAISMGAVMLALSPLGPPTIPTAAALTLLVYLGGYVVRLSCMTAQAKVNDVEITRTYFVQELMVALVVLSGLAVVLWRGSTPLSLPALSTGVLYSGLYLFGTLVYLDRRENTFCIPLNRSVSLLAGVAASFSLAIWFGFALPSRVELVSAAMLAGALLLLSPLHHWLEYARNIRVLVRHRDLVPVRQASMQQVFLFVCSGNTCRSPMAEAIGNAEIVRRHRESSVRAASAGVAATDGAPMTEPTVRALATIDIASHPHAARRLTEAIVAEADVIFCMTGQHRMEIIRSLPSAAAKTECLDPSGDIPDPTGSSLEAYADCARRMQTLIRQQFDRSGV